MLSAQELNRRGVVYSHSGTTRKLVSLLLLLVSTLGVWSQGDFQREDDLLSAEFHAARRKQLRDSLPPNSVAILFAAPERNRANDVYYEYHQSPDFYYLTGFTEPDAVLIISSKNIELNEVVGNEFIFVRERNVQSEQWTGRRLGPEGVQAVLGIRAFSIKKFSSTDLQFDGFSRIFLVALPQGMEENAAAGPNLRQLAEVVQKQLLPYSTKTDYERLKFLLMLQRQIKHPVELPLLQKAIDATCDGLHNLAKELSPGMTEYQAEAVVEYFFKKNGSEHPGYPSILGAGENSCILHYNSNRQKISSDHMLLADVGAEYHGYTADVTRTFPADGIFSPEEKAIYELVLKAQLAGIEACKKGNLFTAPDEAARKVIEDGLLQLGIIRERSAARKYFPHGTSHYLGLDVHDPGDYGPLQEGQVITVEPGIYIPPGSPCDSKWWNLGVRIEDDILITADHPRVLSACMPKSVEEIEQLMALPGVMPR